MATVLAVRTFPVEDPTPRSYEEALAQDWVVIDDKTPSIFDPEEGIRGEVTMSKADLANQSSKARRITVGYIATMTGYEYDVPKVLAD